MLKLEEMLEYVSQYNDFYKSIICKYKITNPTNISQYPVITRQQLQQNRYNMFSEGYKSKYFNQSLYRKSSSGSSGVPVNVYWDYSDYYRSNINLWRLRTKFYRIEPSSKKALFALSNYMPFYATKKLSMYNINKNVLNINRASIQSDQQFIEAIQRINDFSPEWLYIQPSILLRLEQCYKKYNLVISKSLRYIESFGEILSALSRDHFSKFFDVPIANMYGSEEHNGIAYQCPYGKMHIISDNVKVEILSNGTVSDYGEGEAIITNLNNHAMPLIRYNQGDVIVKNKRDTSCLCGSYDDEIQVIKGRQYQILKDGDFEISPFLLNEVMSEVQNQYDDPILDYSYLFRNKINSLTLRIVINPVFKYWTSEITKSLEQTFYSKLNYNSKILFNIEVYDSLVEHENIKKKHCILHIEE